ncbi:helix-turn-helix domain-containing protein [Corynebacterium variabile]|uniref:helix-turn-helix domain-containing protein n=1 Tax=Corynebacterium variabile TaxID=1727 RepID=UPI0028AC064B|nr:helix-turn-helix domain-containing protein [Corynebacterium variabile]
MNATLASASHITISDTVMQDAQTTLAAEASTITIQSSNGDQLAVPESLRRLILDTLTSVAQNGEVSISRVPEEITSTVAADMLGVSRTTLMKWARSGKIDSFKVGSHTRFKRDEVLRMQREREAEKAAAFEKLRAFDDDHAGVFDN